MALIKCRECGKKFSDTAEACIHCGCPLGKVIFNTTNDWIGVVGKYIITDEDNNVLATLKSNEQFEMNISEDTVFYVKCNTALSRKPIEVEALANTTNKFLVGLGALGSKTIVSKLD